MSFWNTIHDEIQAFKEALHPDPLQERTWLCRPLLVMDDEGEVAFLGNTMVKVEPLSGVRANLIADGQRDGWRPSLNNAAVELILPKGTTVIAGRPGNFRGGIHCKGNDVEGNEFDWYINGAAEAYAHFHLNGFDPTTLPDEEPVSE